MKTRINVTRNDIKNGRRACNTDCPIAKAIDRKLKNKYYVAVYKSQIDIYPYFEYDYGHKYNEDQIPESVTNFIRTFDKNISVKPFSFTLDIPNRFLKKE